MDSNGSLEGFDIDIWNEIAASMGHDTTFRLMPFDNLLQSVREGDLDAAVAGISVTYSRELRIDFSVPYMNTGLRILAPVQQGTALTHVLQAIATGGVLTPLGYLLGFVLLCAHVLYFAERGSPAVNDRYFPGIFEACWCVLATITTVGYGDIAPAGWLGRFVAFLVMVIGISLFGVAIAELSAGLTVGELRGDVNGPADLHGRRVATVAGTTSVGVARRYGAKVLEVPVVEDGYDLLGAGEVDAVLFDAAPLLRYSLSGGNKNLSVVGPLLERQDYAVAFPQGSELREPVNRALLQLRESGRYDAIFARWFGSMQ